MPEDWRQCRLGDVITLKRGYDLPRQDRKPGRFPVVSSAGVTGWHDVAKARGPGVVTGRYGTLGDVHFVREDYWPLNTSLYVEDFKGNDPRFISYFLRGLDFGTRNAAGAVPGVNRNHLHAMQVTLPPVDTQQLISRVLAAFDDLIENNSRRILILEGMARALYREWFVHLRFPGHETVAVAESAVGRVPQHWAVKKLGEVLALNYGKALKHASRREGAVPVFGSSGVVGFHDKSMVEGPGLIIGRKGNVGSVFYSETAFYPIDTVFYVTSSLPLRYLYYDLLTKNFINSDAAVPGLSRRQAYSLQIAVPPNEVLEPFGAMVDVFDGQATVLQRQNDILRRTRDLLLPSLMSGQLKLRGPKASAEGAAA